MEEDGEVAGSDPPQLDEQQAASASASGGEAAAAWAAADEAAAREGGGTGSSTSTWAALFPAVRVGAAPRLPESNASGPPLHLPSRLSFPAAASQRVI